MNLTDSDLGSMVVVTLVVSVFTGIMSFLNCILVSATARRQTSLLTSIYRKANRIQTAVVALDDVEIAQIAQVAQVADPNYPNEV